MANFFFGELTEVNKHIIDASCGGTFIELEEEAYQFLENSSRNYLNYTSASIYDRNIGNFTINKIYEIRKHDELILKINTINRNLKF